MRVDAYKMVLEPTLAHDIGGIAGIGSINARRQTVVAQFVLEAELFEIATAVGII